MANIASVINPKTYLPQSTQPLLSTPACLTIPSSHHTILSMLPPAVFIQITDLTLLSQASRPLSILTPLHWSKIFACLPSEITSVLHFLQGVIPNHAPLQNQRGILPTALSPPSL